MPRRSTGKWVSRAGATGGGRTYRGQMPVNWYAALVLIVLVGIASVVYSRYEYQHPTKSTAAFPKVGQTLFAGLSIDICGTVQKPLPASTNTIVPGITTLGHGVLNVSPLTASEAGNNATLGLFFDHYKGVALNAHAITVPKNKTYKVGDKCGAGTKYAGQPAVLKYEVWPNPVATSGTLTTGDPSTLKIGARTLITVGFVPASVTKLPKPPATTVNGVIVLSGTVSNGTTTTTTAPPTTSTTAPGGTTTTAPSGTTTTAPTGTTTPAK